MTNYLPTILAIFPFLVFIFLLLIKKIPLLKTSVITLAIYTILAIFYWQILPSFLYISYGKGIFVAFDIFIIIFGAIFFLQILKDLKIIQNISHYLSGISKDYRVQIIIIAWFFACFLEGTAGFGVPAAIAVPILMSLGLPPIRSLVVGLLGNSTPGVFGAAGTPIKVGMAGLNTTGVPYLAALLNSVGIIIPVFMLWVITKGRENRKKEFLEALPFALWSGIVFIIPSILAVSLGQEFPTIIGSIVGLILIIISIKLKIFIPKNNLSLVEQKESFATMSAFKAFLPYGLLVSFLILGKILIGKVVFPLSLGFNHNFALYNPGLAFLIAGFITILIWKNFKKIISVSSKFAFKGAVGPFLVIATMLSMVQIMINSGQNLSGLTSALNLIAMGFENNLLPFLAPFAGAFGAFMTGSVTVSNIMFGNLINTAALNLGLTSSIILALLVVGAAAGNMIALADILVAEAVVGQKNAERQILKGVIIPCLTYLILVGIIGLIVFNLF
jgi:lactate permease